MPLLRPKIYKIYVPNLSVTGSLRDFQKMTKPLYDTGKRVFQKDVSVGDRAKIAKVTHDLYFNYTDGPAIANPHSYYCDPRKIRRANLSELENILTPKGRAEAEKFVSGTHIGQVSIVPAQIQKGQADSFLAFFGKTEQSAISGLNKLILDGDSKTKIVNNQAMSWEDILSRCEGKDAIYSGKKSLEMLSFEASLQTEGIIDSAIVIAAIRKSGVIQWSDRYPLYHALWATHNARQKTASINFADLEPHIKEMETAIVDSHLSHYGLGSPLFSTVYWIERMIEVSFPRTRESMDF